MQTILWNDGGLQAAPRSGAPASAAPSLDTKCQILIEEGPDQASQQENEGLGKPKGENPSSEVGRPNRPSWDRKQKRAYHKALTLLKYWDHCGYQAFFVTLTGAPGSQARQLSYHHERLKLAVVRAFKVEGIEHFKVITQEGHGVIHALWAIPPAQNGVRDKAAYIPQQWLSKSWERIHGARIVDIRRVTPGGKSQRNLSKYIVSQYVGGQSGFVRSDYTRPKWLGFPIRRTWEELKRNWRERRYTSGIKFKDVCSAWERLIYVRSCSLGDRQYVVWQRKLEEV